MNTLAPIAAATSIGVSRQAAGLVPYATPERAEHIDLRLDANEGPRPGIDLAGLMSRIGDDAARGYPSAAGLEALLSVRWGVSPDRVIVTSGGDDAIDRACRACLGLDSDSELILPTPTFEMIERYARLAGGEVLSVPWWTGPFPTRDVLDRVSSRTRMVVVVSPNNPTGAVATREDVIRLAAGAPDAVLLVDAAYGEFADEDLTQAALSLPRAVVVRTFSKAYGLAGLRLGYAMGPAEIIRSMRAVGAPYPASALSLAVGADQVRSAEARVNRTVGRVRHERRELAALLTGLGANPLPSQANFVLAEFADPEWVWSALRSLGIATRKFTGGSRLASCLRITCPADSVAFARLAAGLEAALRPGALLLDMDGVLADVSASYRRAIMLTAERFGAFVSADEVSAAKLQPGSNNDWVVTQRLLAARSIDVPLEIVAERFNQLYRGDNRNVGLEALECLIPSRELLQRLAARLPLGIVSGRPRRDAETFLDRFDLRALFKAVVCMEDAPAKPSPAPVALALQRLGVQHAWMIGDTPDDVRSARGAGVVSLGIAAPSNEPTQAGLHLAKAGAARVVDSLAALEELLP
jgi:histidinol-phosphate aminotransferase